MGRPILASSSARPITSSGEYAICAPARRYSVSLIHGAIARARLHPHRVPRAAQAPHHRRRQRDPPVERPALANNADIHFAAATGEYTSTSCARMACSRPDITFRIARMNQKPKA